MFVIEIPYMDLEQIAGSGQTYRWVRLGGGSDKYAVLDGDTCLKVTQNRSMFSFNCSEEEFWEKWWKYFDLMTDYEKAHIMIRKEDAYVSTVMDRYSGIRMLNQDVWEVMICAIIREGKTYRWASDAINTLCSVYGKKKSKSVGEGAMLKWYTFPTPEQILQKDIDELECIGKKEIIGLIYTLAEECASGEIMLDSSDLLEKLENLGVSEYVLDCIKTYALHDMNSFPKSDMLEKAIEKECKDGLEKYKEFESLVKLVILKEENARKELSKYGIAR